MTGSQGNGEKNKVENKNPGNNKNIGGKSRHGKGGKSRTKPWWFGKLRTKPTVPSLETCKACRFSVQVDPFCQRCRKFYRSLISCKCCNRRKRNLKRCKVCSLISKCMRCGYIDYCPKSRRPSSGCKRCRGFRMYSLFCQRCRRRPPCRKRILCKKEVPDACYQYSFGTDLNGKEISVIFSIRISHGIPFNGFVIEVL